MAAATVVANKQSKGDVRDGMKREIVQLTIAADGDTYDVSSYFDNVWGVFVSFNDAAAVAADSVAVTWTRAGVITFETAGTVRQMCLLILGE